MILFIILVALFSFLQTTFLPVDVVTWMVLWGLLVWSARKAWLMALLAGVMVDLTAGRELGWSVLIYLLIGGGLHWYRRKYNAVNRWFLFLLGLVTMWGFNWAVRGQWVWVQGLITGLSLSLLSGRIKDSQRGSRQLKLEYGGGA